MRAELVEEVAELEVLRFGVRDGAAGVLAQERPADLRRLVPAIDVQEARAADGRAVTDAPREERHLVAEDLLLERRSDPALELAGVPRHGYEHQPPDVVLVRDGKELGGVLPAQRLEAHVRAAERHGSWIELGPRTTDHVGHLHVVGPGAFVGHHAIALDALDLEAGGLVRGDGAVVVREHAERDAVHAEVIDQMLHEKAKRLAAESLSPEIGLADADPHLRTPTFWLQVAVVHLADRTSLVFDREHDAAVAGDEIEPLASRILVRETAGPAAPLVPGEVRVVRPADQMRCVGVRHRPERDALAAQDRGGHRRRRHAIASPALVTESATLASCAAKSAGSVLLSRSF